MDPIRVLHVMNNFADSSISRIVERIARTLDDGRYEWHVAGLNGHGVMEDILKDLKVETIHFPPRPVEGPKRARSIRACLIERQIHIVHTHTPRTITELFIAMTGMSTRPRHLATKHLLTTPKDRRWGAYYSLFDTLTLYMPDRLVTVSETMQGKVSTLPGKWNGRVTSVRNAIPCENFYLPSERSAARLDLGFDPGQIVFGYAGRIAPVKLLDLLLKAFAEVHEVWPETRLLLIGDGQQRIALQQYANDLGLERAVTWTGFRADVPSLLSAMDVYVQPSHNEGLSLSILEAMAAGKPVVATEVGGANELLCHRETGLLVPAHSTTALSNAMLELAAQPEYRKRLGEAARKYVSEKFNLQQMTTAYDQIYRSLVSGNVEREQTS